MKLFKLVREVDDSGVSGTGVVCLGAALTDGRVVLEWVCSKYQSIEILESIEAVIEIHGHNGHTKVEWL